MTRISLLEKLYQHAFDMVQFGESKNISLIAFNTVTIIGMAFALHFSSNMYICYYALFAIISTGISILIGFSALIAKVKNKTYEINLTKNDNLLYFATVAHMTDSDLLEKLSSHYNCISENENYERDLAKQAIITSQIASRKFLLFNWAIGFTIAGIATPLSILVYKLIIVRDK